MSELRDRIAAVIYGAASQWDDYPWDALAEHIKALYLGQADAVIAELGMRQEFCVQYTHAPRYKSRGLDACDDCSEPTIHDQKSASALMEKLNSRGSRFKPERVTRYVTDWKADDETD